MMFDFFFIYVHYPLMEHSIYTYIYEVMSRFYVHKGTIYLYINLSVCLSVYIHLSIYDMSIYPDLSCQSV